ncbi:MAG TPA: class I SAM-dependent methyltransferase [Cytophagaceae bacterium]|nr:class I SAM-dependent methyltransferase [Cytophagaceae bacterium]
MATKQDLDFTYTTIDEIFRLSFGEMADYSGARFDGDFSLSIEEAQRQKHKFIADSLNVKAGSKVLDMACGWGPYLNYVKSIGGKGMGVTLSSGQAAACVRNGLDVKVMDCRKITPDMYGTFDAVSCIGGLEHFCSVEEYQAGKQDDIYKNFFKSVSDLLPQGGRYYMQTMVFSKNMIPFEKIDINADKNSDSYTLALMVKQFPGSWLPYGDEHVIRSAAPYFKLISKSSGRLDYIETIKRWRKNFRKFNLKKYLLYISLIPKLFTDKEFRHQVAVFRTSPNKICFERETMDHYRLVFEKI